MTRGQEPIGPGRWQSATWDNIPAAHLDAEPGTNIEVAPFVIAAAEPLAWRTAAAAWDVSLQLLVWTINGPAVVEAALTASVETTLEHALLTGLATAAVTAATLADAETAVAATDQLPDLLVCHPTDRASVVRAYAAENVDPADRPRILPTAGATPGVALVMASPLVDAVAGDLDWLIADSAAAFGKDVAALRAGVAYARTPAAVAAVNL